MTWALLQCTECQQVSAYPILNYYIGYLLQYCVLVNTAQYRCTCTIEKKKGRISSRTRYLLTVHRGNEILYSRIVEQQGTGSLLPFSPLNHTSDRNHSAVFYAGIQFQSYSPLGAPERPPRNREANAPLVMADPALKEIAAKHSCSVAQVSEKSVCV